MMGTHVLKTCANQISITLSTTTVRTLRGDCVILNKQMTMLFILRIS